MADEAPVLVLAGVNVGWDHLLMGEDDPEQRIVELESQLADGNAAPRLTTDDVHARGYNEDEVEAFRVSR